MQMMLVSRLDLQDDPVTRGPKNRAFLQGKMEKTVYYIRSAYIYIYIDR